MALLFAVLEPAALVVLEHAVAAAEFPLAEGAVADDALGSVFAVFEGAFLALGGAGAAEEGEGHGEGGEGGEKGGEG